MEPADICQSIRTFLPHVKPGTLRVWGDWFGKPYDNIHKIISCEPQDASITLHFDHEETLQIWKPEGFKITETDFEIHSAQRIRWEWFDHGRPATTENRMFHDYSWDAGNVKLLSTGGTFRSFSVVYPVRAVELL